ncbi:MAG: dihydrodipicolinate synthase family protein [Kiritimatiellae bacterium]|nr:dihydrodipicolinate synthase family protein [Kiritimatiellia bacterium]
MEQSRREFIRNSAAGISVAVAGWPGSRVHGAPDATRASAGGCPPDVRDALSGPWPSIRTPFTKSGEIDYGALRKMIDFMIEEGKAKAVVLTCGDSLFTVLTDDEIARLTKDVASCLKKRAYFVAATSDRWWTGKSVEFAKYCRAAGADMLMALPPDWAHSTTVDSLVSYYQAVSEHIPVMVVTNYLNARGTAFGLELIGRLLREAPRVIALKDDVCGEFIRKAALLAHGRWAMSAGGQKQNHMNMLPYGADGYLSTFLTFKPEIARCYWRAVEARDLTAAAAVIRDYDMPFFEHIIKTEGSFDAAMHGVYELYGLAERWRRPPYHSLSYAQMERLSGFLKSKKLLS